MHREQATDSPLSLGQVIREIVLPTTENRVHDKTMGYYLWLVLGARLFGGLGTPSGTDGCSVSTTERAWQLANVALLLIQLACVYKLAAWALRDRPLAVSVAALYLVSPIVFGMNRWVMTENHVMAGLWVTVTMAVLASTVRRSFVPPLAAFAMGTFATLREYALPLVVVLALATIAALLWERRWLAAGSFGAVVVPYMVCAAVAAKPSFSIAIDKLFTREGQVQFYNPLPIWFAHMTLESWGPSLTVLIAGGVLLLVVRAGVATRQRRICFDGLTLIWGSIGLLLAGTLGGVVLTIQRLVRPSIPPFIFGLAFVLLGVRILQLNGADVRRRLFAIALGALCVSWAFLLYHLFVRFDHGSTFRHHAAYMEYYDHPLWLRPLHGTADRHI